MLKLLHLFYGFLLTTTMNIAVGQSLPSGIEVSWSQTWYRSDMPIKRSGHHLRVPQGFIGCDDASKRRKGRYSRAVAVARLVLSLEAPNGIYVPFVDLKTQNLYIAHRERHSSTRVPGKDGKLVDMPVQRAKAAVTLFCGG
jgi:hypothetical protein